MKRADLEALAILSIELQIEEIRELLGSHNTARVCVDQGEEDEQAQLVVEFANPDPEFTYDSEFDSSGYTILPLRVIIPDNWKWKKTNKAVKNIDKHAQKLFSEIHKYL